MIIIILHFFAICLNLLSPSSSSKSSKLGKKKVSFVVPHCSHFFFLFFRSQKLIKKKKEQEVKFYLFFFFVSIFFFFSSFDDFAWIELGVKVKSLFLLLNKNASILAQGSPPTSPEMQKVFWANLEFFTHRVNL